jgi:TRAP-type C4-dicarboxylate transport system substrate-binding protein
MADLAGQCGRSTIMDKEGDMVTRCARQGWIWMGLAAAIFLAWVVMPALAEAGQPEYRWRAGSAWTQKTRNESVQLFTELVNKYSNGRIEIRFQHSGLLGTHDELFHAVREGSVDMTVVSPYVNLVPGGMLNWMPWTVGSFEEAKVAYAPGTGIIYKIMDDAYGEVGHKPIWTTHQGAYGIGNRTRAIKTPDDFSKLKLRVSGSLGFVRTLENMGKGTGMTLQTLPWADIYNALQTGVVDGAWSLWPSLVEERHYEVLKYYTDLAWGWDANSICLNRKTWDKLPQDLKDVLIRAGKEAEARDMKEMQNVIEEYKKKMTGAGIQIYTPTEPERDAFRKKANMPAVWKELATPWLDKKYPGQNMTEKVMAELDKIAAVRK